MDTNRKVFRDSSPALGTELGCVFGRNFNYSASGSLFRFPFENIEEFKPSHISHRPIKRPKTIPRVQFFDEDNIIIFNQPVGGFEMKIPPLIKNLLVGFGNQYSGLLPSVRIFDPAGEPLLSHCKYVLRFLKEAGVFYFFVFRGSKKGFATNINAYRLASLRERSGRNIITGKIYIPLTCRCLTDGDSFNVAFYRPGKTEFESAYVPNREVFAIKLPTSLFECKRIIPISTLEAGETCFAVAIPNPSEKPRIGFIQPLKHLLKHLRAYLSVFRKGDLEFGKLFSLIIARDRAFVLSVNSNSLLKSRVVEMSTEVKPVIGLLKGLRVSLNAILKRLFHLSCTKFNIVQSKKGDKWAFIPALKGRVFSPTII